jgi:PIN domain nuclease of toxin-antitoxin system
VVSLPPFHGDPFDRLLNAHAMSEPLHLITMDERLKPYCELVVLV